MASGGGQEECEDRFNSNPIRERNEKSFCAAQRNCGEHRMLRSVGQQFALK